MSEERIGSPASRVATRMRLARNLVAWILVGTLAAAAGACGSTGRPLPGANPFEEGGGTRPEIRIRVRNSNFYDATLTAISDQGTRRLGNVGGNSSAVFTTPWSFTTGLRIQIDLLAGPTCTTDVVTMSPGETLDLEIPPDFRTATTCR